MRLTLDPSLEYGVVLEGGGARGAYQIGALKAVTEAGIRIGAVAGASVGALSEFECRQSKTDSCNYQR